MRALFYFRSIAPSLILIDIFSSLSRPFHLINGPFTHTGLFGNNNRINSSVLVLIQDPFDNESIIAGWKLETNSAIHVVTRSFPPPTAPAQERFCAPLSFFLIIHIDRAEPTAGLSSREWFPFSPLDWAAHATIARLPESCKTATFL